MEYLPHQPVQREIQEIPRFLSQIEITLSFTLQERLAAERTWSLAQLMTFNAN